MKNVGWAALIGAGVALVAFIIDWIGDVLEADEEPEPLWPASKPYSRISYSYDDPNPVTRWPPFDDEKARTTTYYGTDDWVAGVPGPINPSKYGLIDISEWKIP